MQKRTKQKTKKGTPFLTLTQAVLNSYKSNTILCLQQQCSTRKYCIHTAPVNTFPSKSMPCLSYPVLGLLRGTCHPVWSQQKGPQHHWMDSCIRRHVSVTYDQPINTHSTMNRTFFSIESIPGLASAHYLNRAWSESGPTFRERQVIRGEKERPAFPTWDGAYHYDFCREHMRGRPVVLVEMPMLFNGCAALFRCYLRALN